MFLINPGSFLGAVVAAIYCPQLMLTFHPLDILEKKGKS
jgi:hypothetical protein